MRSTIVKPPTRSGLKGFTLVELLIVVTILAILALLVIPQVSSATTESREAALKEELRQVRIQINLFRAQMGDVMPGFPEGNPATTPDETQFVAHMTQFIATNFSTSPTRTADHTFGPYLPRIPTNPINGLSTVAVLDDSELFVADGTTGWIYQPRAGRFVANLTGKGSDGRDYTNY
jgi:general secretion pathway protein G